MSPKPQPSQIAILAGGIVLLVFSFVDWGGDRNAWSEFGLLTWPAILGVITAGSLALTTFASVKLPEPIVSFTWAQIRLVLAATAALVLVGLLGFDNKGGGYWLSFLGGIALLAGTVLEVLQDDPATSSSTDPSAPAS